MADGYTPTTQGGAAPSSNPYSTPKTAFGTGDFDVRVGHPDPRVTPPSLTGGSRPAGDRGFEDASDTTKRSANELLQSLLTMSTAQILQLQDRMIAAGLLPKSGRSGTADTDTQRAYGQLLAETSQYNSQGVDQTPDDLLDTKIASRKSAGVGADGTGSVYSPQDPATIKQTLEQLASESMGKRRLPPAVIEKFTAYFHGLQQSAFKGSQVAQDGGAATVTTPDLGAQAQQFIDSNFATEEASHDIVGYMGALRGLLGGG